MDTLVLNFYLFIAFQGLVLALSLLTKKKNRYPNIILALLLIITSIDILVDYAHQTGLALEYTKILFLNGSFPFLYAPLFYLYICFSTAQLTRIRAGILLHLLPFALDMIKSSVVFYSLAPHEKVSFAQQILAGHIHPAIAASNVFALIIYIVYFIFSAKRLVQYNRRIRDFSSALFKMNLWWLKLVIFHFILHILIYIAFIITYWMLHITHFEGDLLSIVLLNIFASFFIYLVGYVALFQPEKFTLAEHTIKLLRKGKTSREEPSLEKMKEQLPNIINYIEESKIYLNPELTLQELASAVSLTELQVSQTINTVMGINFYKLINGYRVKEVKRQLSDQDSNDTILAIAFDAGFNSKAAFNSVFKEFVGKTPKQFRTDVFKEG